MRILFLPLAVPRQEPLDGALSRALPRELAARLQQATDAETIFFPFLHVVEERRLFGVYPTRWPREDLLRLLAEAPNADLVVHGEVDFDDPLRLTLEVLRAPGLEQVEKERLSRFEDLSDVEKLELRENFAQLRSYDEPERARIRANAERFRGLPDERRRKIRAAWERLRQLTPAEREAVAEELLRGEPE